MWPLRQNVLYNKHYFFKDIVTFVFIFHVILLGILFVSDSGKFNKERFALNNHNVSSTIIFMPLKKRVVDQPKIVDTIGKKDDPRKIVSYAEYEKKRVAQEKKQKKVKISHKKAVKIVPVVKTPIVKKALPVEVKKNQIVKVVPAKKVATTLSVDNKKQLIDHVKSINNNKIAQEITKKAFADQAQLKIDNDKIVAVKNAQQIIDAQTIKDQAKKLADQLAEKVLADNIALQEKIELLAASIKSVKLEPVLQSIVPEIVSADLDEDEEDDDDYLDNITFVGSHDLEMIQIKEQIQAQVVKHYKPPVGIAKKAICELVVMVGVGGQAEQVTVKKASGSMANDICARAALFKVVYPKEVIGKEIIVELGQS